jgi:lipopolysaccharide transport system permease protein
MPDALIEQIPSGGLDEGGRLPSAAPPWSPEGDRQTVYEAHAGWQFIRIGELWRFRELLYFLTWRDVKVRYKQTLLGALWAILQPFMMMVVFTIFLGRMAGVDSGDVPYPVFVYAGLLPWMFFSTAIANAGNSVVNAQQMITKIYFPRLLIPFSAVAAAVVDFFIAFVMLLALMAYYRIMPGMGMWLTPFLLVLAILAATGIGTALAALNVAFRDFKYTIPFLVQIWMFATPTVYMNIEALHERDARSADTTMASSAESGAAAPADERGDRSSRLPASVRPLLILNPMTGLIAFFRAATLGGPLPWSELGYASAVIAVMFVAGIMYFRRVEDSFADII